MKQNDKKKDKITSKLTTLDDRIVEAVRGNKYITIPELAALTDKSESTIHRHLDVLVKSGRITRVGSRKTGFWEIQ